MRDLSDAANELTKPLERAVTATFDIREMGLRRQAQAQFAGAGGDVHAQAQVFAQLKTSIDHLARQETTALQAVTATARPSVGFGIGGGSASGTGSVGVGAGDLVKAGVPMSSVVEIVPSRLDEFGVTGYADLIDFGGDLAKIKKPWHHALEFRASHLVDEFGVSRYSQIVDFSGDVARINRPWHYALRFWQGNLVSDFGVSRYSQIVDFSGDVGKIGVPWGHAVSFAGRIQISSFSQIFDIQAAPIAIHIGDIVTLVGNPRKISIADLVDLSDLEGIVGGIVARNTSNRSGGDTRVLSRSEVGQQGRATNLAADDRQALRRQASRPDYSEFEDIVGR
jgi:hypothetical protein